MATQSKVSRQRHKDKKIIIYKETSTQDGSGYPIEAYTPIHAGKLWAYVRQQSASEYYAAHAVQITEDMLFVVNWRADLITNQTLSLYILYKGLWYNVQRIDTFEGYKEDLQIYGKLVRTPDAGSIKPTDSGVARMQPETNVAFTR